MLSEISQMQKDSVECGVCVCLLVRVPLERSDQGRREGSNIKGCI